MTEAPAIVWLRQDLRLADNPALHAACASGRPLILLYVLDDETPGRWRLGGAPRWWLHRSLQALARDIAKLGGALVLRNGNATVELPRLVTETGAKAVYWNRCYEPFAIARDGKLKEQLSANGIEAHSFQGSLLHEPWSVNTKTGAPFKVFTPFWRTCLTKGVSHAPRPAPKRLTAATCSVVSDSLDDWKLLPRGPNWAAGFETEWSPGEAGARVALAAFLGSRLGEYKDTRDQLGTNGTSRLSPHLHFGEISPLQVWSAAGDAAGADKFLSEIGWREFSHLLLFHWPTLPDENWRSSFDAFPWREDEAALEAWRYGHTGYPLVDAAMRELWTTGYMHNRARMIAASFLVKHLLIDWRRGADWFWDTLLDADLANNSASWQWVAGCGADAAPYFRIFNPVAQGQRYDFDGAYVRRWVPELARLPDASIHCPWDASDAERAAAGVELGQTYPAPIVDHAAARARALAAFGAMSSRP